MNNYKKTLPFCFFLLAVNLLYGQVKFELNLLEDGETYQVSLISDKTIPAPLNVTSTAQVTIKVPTGSFALDQLVSLQEEVVWEANSKTMSPSESPQYDYFSFGLISQGTDKIAYQKNTRTLLFTFTNQLDCTSEISLIDNLNDPFSPPNSRQVNVGNQITILGTEGDAYVGNTEANVVYCGDQLTAIEDVDKKEIHLSIFPNPTTQYTTLAFNWDRKRELTKLSVLAMNGKVVQEKEVDITKGKNQISLDVRNLSPGNYFLELKGTTWKITSDQILKMRE